MTLPSELDPAQDTKLYVLIPPSPLFAAHWSLFVPKTLPFDAVTRRRQESNHGRRVHVTGDRLNGFSLEIIRGYDVKKHRSVGSRRYAIGIIPARYLEAAPGIKHKPEDGKAKDDDEGGGRVDNRPMDDFERAVVGIEAPGPSLNNVRTGEQRVTRKSEVRDCQWWVREVVRKLVDDQVLQPVDKDDPIALVASLPAH